MPLYDYLTPKLDFKRKFNHRQSFLYKGRLTVRTIRKFRTGSSVRIESRIGSSIRTRIESRSFAGHYNKHTKFGDSRFSRSGNMIVGVKTVNACNWMAAVCAAEPLALANQLPLPRMQSTRFGHRISCAI